jgi:hypothetical protein
MIFVWQWKESEKAGQYKLEAEGTGEKHMESWGGDTKQSCSATKKVKKREKK